MFFRDLKRSVRGSVVLTRRCLMLWRPLRCRMLRGRALGCRMVRRCGMLHRMVRRADSRVLHGRMIRRCGMICRLSRMLDRRVIGRSSCVVDDRCSRMLHGGVIRRSVVHRSVVHDRRACCRRRPRVDTVRRRRGVMHDGGRTVRRRTMRRDGLRVECPR